METDLIPYSAMSTLPAQAALVLAPHADDEIFGCGGAIASHVRAGIAVHVIILTDGSRFGQASGRADESRAAADVLGYGLPEFWNLPDRGLHYSEELVQRIVVSIERSGADLVYAPSPWEIHPDHRQTSLLAIEAIRRVKTRAQVAFYEVGSPLRPNCLLDITASAAIKETAMRCFKSQLVHQDYVRHIQALNQYRTYTLPREISAAEAYWVVTSNEFDQAAAQNLFTSVSPGLTVGASLNMRETPLISILIRSMDREFLSQALDSIALQTYPNIEVVVVAAVTGHQPLPLKCGPFNLRLVSTDVPLMRSRCANKALEQALGSFLLFLDDDDWLMPAHIARLAHASVLQPNALAIYTGISLVDIEGLPMGQIFDLPFDAIRQMAGNLMPIHAVLFSAKVLERGCRFDELLDRYEDWDFWLQLARLAPMVHLPGVSAAYRIHNSSGVHTDTGPTGKASGSIYQKWETAWTREQIGQIMQRVWTHPELETRLVEAHERLTNVQSEVVGLRESTVAIQTEQTQKALEWAQQELALSLKQSAAARQEYILGQREIALAHQESVLTQRSLEVTKSEAFIVQRDLSLAQRLSDAEQQRKFHESMNEQAAAKLAKSNHDMAAILNSRSWRMTHPLRRVSAQLRHKSWFKSGLRKTRRLIEVSKQEGLRGTWNFLLERIHGSFNSNSNYREIVEQSESSVQPGEKSDAVLLNIEAFAHRPVISIVMPVYNPPLHFLKEAVASVQNQIYPHWELCIADDASPNPAIVEYLNQISATDSRIKLVLRQTNGHIVAASNSALSIAEGEFIALLDHDDLISNDALFWVVDALNRIPEAAIVYSDEDKLNLNGERCDPYFKSDWNLELFLSQNMISHFGVYRRLLVEEVGGFRSGYDGSQDYDLALRCVLKIQPSQIVHVARVLYHWRILPGSTALSPGEKSYAQDAGKRALSEFLTASELGGQVQSLPNGYYRIHPALPSTLPLVSLLIPTRNALALVRQCILSILTKTTYSNYEILLIDNGSDDPAALAYFAELNQHSRIRVIRDENEFNFAALNNRAVAQANGSIVALINNDLEIITPGWLEEMVGLVLRPGVGAVGAKLWYPDNTLQHGGIIIGLGGVAGHSHWGISRNDPGYFGRAELTQVLSAVTAACLVVRKSVYDQVCGLNEVNLKVAFNDVDFCLKLTELGYRNIWTPYAEMYHHESATRGSDDSPAKKDRFANEVAYMHQRWGHLFANDPYYNVNLTLILPSFVPVWPPRQQAWAHQVARATHL